MPDTTAPAPTPAPATPARPDALFIPESFRVGATKYDRADSICTFAEGILGADKLKSQRAYVRRQPGARVFVTLDPDDTIAFPRIGSNRGPRYAWVKQPNGVEYGYLVDAAKEAPGA